jgi:hypothetical protein
MAAPMVVVVSYWFPLWSLFHFHILPLPTKAANVAYWLRKHIMESHEVMNNWVVHRVQGQQELAIFRLFNKFSTLY